MPRTVGGIAEAYPETTFSSETMSLLNGEEPLNNAEEESFSPGIRTLLQQVDLPDQAPPPLAHAAVGVPGAVVDWGPLSNAIRAGALGAPIVPAAVAARTAIDQIHSLRDVPGAVSRIPENYQRLEPQFEAARQEWARRFPQQNFGTNMAAVPATIALMRWGGRVGRAAGGPLLDALAVRAPRTAEALGIGLDVLAGSPRAGMGALARLGTRLAGGVTQGAVAGGLMSQVAPEIPLKNQILTGAAAGGAVNAVTSPLVEFLAGRVGIAPSVADAMRRGQREGFEFSPRPGQVAQGPVLRRVDQLVASGRNAEQLGAFTQDVSRTFGADTRALTKEVMEQERTRIGTDLTNAEAQLGVRPDPQFMTELNAVKQQVYQDLAASPERAQIIKLIDNIRSKTLKPGGLSGEAYALLTRSDSILGKMLSDRGISSLYARPVRNAIDAALERTAKTSGNTAAVRELEQARRQYAAWIMANKATTESGHIDPAVWARAARNQSAMSKMGALRALAPHVPRPTAVGTARPAGLHTRLPFEAKAAAGLLGVDAAVEGLPHMLANPETAAGILAAAAALHGGRRLLEHRLASPAFRAAALEGAPVPFNPLIPAALPFQPGANALFPDPTQIQVQRQR